MTLCIELDIKLLTLNSELISGKKVKSTRPLWGVGGVLISLS